MANYTKLTDFASKDALPTGTPAKIVKGTEIDDELQAIENAIATKADQTYVDAIDLSVVWPVGSVYINAASTSNPSTLLGFGTWVEIGAGKVLVGQDTGDTSFDVMGETGGSKDAVVVEHTHSASSSVTDPGHNHGMVRGAYPDTFNNTTYYPSSNVGTTTSKWNDTTGISVSTTVSSTGESGTNANLQPYIVVKMWQRTA